MRVPTEARRNSSEPSMRLDLRQTDETARKVYRERYARWGTGLPGGMLPRHGGAARYRLWHILTLCLVLIVPCGTFLSRTSLLLRGAALGGARESGTARWTGRRAWSLKLFAGLQKPNPGASDVSPEKIGPQVVGAKIRQLQERAGRGRANADSVLNLLLWMREGGVRPELRTYTAMLNICAAAAKHGGVRWIPTCMVRSSACRCFSRLRARAPVPHGRRPSGMWRTSF